MSNSRARTDADLAKGKTEEILNASISSFNRTCKGYKQTHSLRR